MFSLRQCLHAILFASVPLFAPGTAGAATPVELKTEKIVLDNGLTVIVHEDHKAPVVAVSVWYHIGSADEPAGKTGFAHLFEHLMFSGSENHKGTYFEPFEKAGATGLNGTTWFDRTNYYETVPTTAVDMALWMESDRMGHLLGAIGQKELDTQRGVVQNEKRQHENQPYGRVDQNVLANIFPANHPYHHDTIGSMQDLNGASLDDVKGWFKANYGSANVTIVLAGDITPAILGGLLAESSKSPDYLNFDIGNDAFGGSFTSRINMNLREDKHWAYGASSFAQDALGQRAFMFYAPVQTDKTAESVTELRKEARAVVGDKPLTAAEIAKVKENNIRSLPGSFETGQEVMAAIDGIVKYGRPDDSVQTLKSRVEAITPATAQSALAKVVKPESITWVVVGDRRKVEQPVRALTIGEVTLLDADGHPIGGGKKK